MRRPLSPVTLLAAVLLIGACASGVPQVETGAPAPAVNVVDTSGRPVALSDFRGQVVLLNFWALWCEPCKAEMPDFQAALERHSERGLAVVTVDLGDRPEDVKAFLDENRYTFLALVDPKLAVRKSYDTRILPLSLLIDRAGIVRYQRVTPFEPGQLESLIGSLMGTPQDAPTATMTAQATGTPAPTPEPSPTASRTALPSQRPTSTKSPTPSATPSPAPSRAAATRTPRSTPVRSPTPTATASPTASRIPPSPTHTPVPEPTMTPTPTSLPTPTDTPVPPVYGVTLTGETYKTVYPNEWVELLGEMVNTGNVEDTFSLGLQIQPRGWEAKYCIGPACYDYTVPSMPVTVLAGGRQPVSVKLKPPADAPAGQTRSGSLWVQSQSDPDAAANLPVMAEVILP